MYFQLLAFDFLENSWVKLWLETYFPSTKSIKIRFITGAYVGEAIKSRQQSLFISSKLKHPLTI